MTTQENARKFLQRLADDDAYRAQVEKDPVGCLAEYGFKVDKAKAPARVKLPSSKEIKANIDQLSERISSTSGIYVFMV